MDSSSIAMTLKDYTVPAKELEVTSALDTPLPQYDSTVFKNLL